MPKIFRSDALPRMARILMRIKLVKKYGIRRRWAFFIVIFNKEMSLY
jgi:hypothetical protein